MVLTGRAFLGRWLSLWAAKLIEAPAFFSALTWSLKGALQGDVPLPSPHPWSLGKNTITTKTNFLFALIKMPVTGIG